MKYYSTRNNTLSVSFRDAILTGLADDGGLLLPERIPELGTIFFKSLPSLSFHDICYEIASKFIENEIAPAILKDIVRDSINFPAPLVYLDEKISVLELFHGPTLAFKDFGARFMARVVEYFIKKGDEDTNILVATSGDTGSAVANGFLGMEGINVFVLYPGGKISEIQEKQITTLGENITALEVDGTFDDCQDLVKKAFTDPEIKKRKNLSSANSINIGRLIPQTFYYFEGFKQLRQYSESVVAAVPSGNLGNLTAGIISKKMGLPLTRIIAAVNSNKTFYEYIKNSDFKPRQTIKTYSNAMDVGNPNNFYRILELFDNESEAIREFIVSGTFTDAETLEGISEIVQKYNYIIDPHGAIGYLGLRNFLTRSGNDNYNGILLETAHPAKFIDIVKKATDKVVDTPDRLSRCFDKEKRAIQVSKIYNDFKEFLLNS